MKEKIFMLTFVALLQFRATVYFCTLNHQPCSLAQSVTSSCKFCQQLEAISAQRQWVPPTTTAAEMRNPYTWYWPYAIAASEAYREYYINAQQISNQLYHQAYLTQTFPSSQQQDNNSNNNRNKGYPRWGWYGRYGRYWWQQAGKYPGKPPANVPEEIPEIE